MTAVLEDKTIPAGADRGTTCPSCHQHVQMYWRTINTQMAQSMIALARWYLEHPGEYAYMPDLIGRKQADEAKLRYWGLAEQDTRTRADGSTRNGYWRITGKGLTWVFGFAALPRYQRVYDSEPIGEPTSVSRTGKVMPDVTITDALGNGFNYRKLLYGEA